MPDPAQPAVSTSSRRTIPTSEVTTDWGLFYATCTHPDRVRFSTDRTIGGNESSLLINRVRYSCSIEFIRGKIAEIRRSSYDRIDDTWRSTNAWHSLRRFGKLSDATDNAHRVLRKQVLPELARWLRSSDASDLLRQGDTYWRAECQRHADAAEGNLSKAFQRVQDLRRAVETGHIITDDEERFLREPYVGPDRRRTR